jgi:hypothetical protein
MTLYLLDRMDCLCLYSNNEFGECAVHGNAFFGSGCTSEVFGDGFG